MSMHTLFREITAKIDFIRVKKLFLKAEFKQYNQDNYLLFIWIIDIIRPISYRKHHNTVINNWNFY